MRRRRASRDMVNKMSFGKSFADQPVKLSRLPSFRAEHFPYSGPYPWLDRDDALEQIAEKLKTGEIDEEQAPQCRFWRENGYIIIPGLFQNSLLDEFGARLKAPFDPRESIWSLNPRARPIRIPAAF